MTVAKQQAAKQQAAKQQTAKQQTAKQQADAPVRMTIEEYLNYDDGTDTRYELIEGQLVEMSAETQINIVIASYLFSLFLPLVPYYCIQRGTEIEVAGRYANTRIPDLMVLSEEGVAALDKDKRSLVTLNMPAPLLAIEMVSSSDRNKDSYERDCIRKRKEYAQRGISEYWLIDPVAEAVLIMSLQKDTYQEQKVTGEQLIISRVFPQIGTEIALSAKSLLSAGLGG